MAHEANQRQPPVDCAYFKTSLFAMPSQYLDTTLLKQYFDTFLNLLATDNDKENALFEYPIDVLEGLLQLFKADERYDLCQLIKNVLAIKSNPPVGTILKHDELQAIYDNAVHTEFKNQLKALFDFS